MKKIVWAVFAAMATISSCQVEEPYSDEVLCDNDIFYAAICDEGSSKTVMDENNNIRWSAGDQLIIFKKTSLGLKYQIQDSYVGKTFGYFSKVTSSSGSDDFGAGMTLDHNVAYYPYLSGVSAEKRNTGYELDVVLPSEQTYAPDSFGNGSFPMAAVSADTDLTFKNICGGIKLQLKGICKVESIVIEGNNGEKLSGAAVVTVYADEEAMPSITMADNASTSVILNCGDGVQLNETTATEFIISLPPTTFTKGFAITVTDTDGGTQTIETSKENEVLRSSLLKMPEVVVESVVSMRNLSEGGTANSYIVSEAGSYKFNPTKGNSSEPVGSIASAEVLWETFGTDVTPNVGDLVKNVKYENGVISFETPSAYKEGNAVIAAKDASGTILWSWHIWLTDKPQGQEYYNDAGTMMDRNLGAISATPGDVGALGLLYQWGRKDPFLGSSSIHNESMTVAKSTIAWPYAVRSDSGTGTIEYATSNPTTFIDSNGSNSDWYYTGKASTDNTRWTTSSQNKSIYDPCPVGWRVPDSGSTCIWSHAISALSFFYYAYDNLNRGMNFSGMFGPDATIWYPSSGYCVSRADRLYCVGDSGVYWSASPKSFSAYELHLGKDGLVNPLNFSSRSFGCSVRCVHESSVNTSPVLFDLSNEGTANSYIVSKSGVYGFTPTKGNSSESVGEIASAEVLWETFGTDVTPNVGDLVKNVKYENGEISFETPSAYKEGNAVIAAKDASGTILWSWHIWLTDQPEGQVYYNNAGTMMDRNLGATSATPGDVGALGLLYQWGRKDPFLGSSSISTGTEAKSTITWPFEVSSDSSNGTIAYATANPTTFIKHNSGSSNYDWYYTGSSSTDNTRWTTSEIDKSIYDPCPSGWRVPDGGSNGVWSKACGSTSDIEGYPYDTTNEGVNFSGKFGSASIIWYPASGYRGTGIGRFFNVGSSGACWSAFPYGNSAYGLFFNYLGRVDPSRDYGRSGGHPVRCLQESK